MGNQFAANSGAALKGLMTRMGHDSERAALIYQSMKHAALTRGSRMRSTLTSRPSATIRATMPTTARLGRSSPLANCTLIARKAATTVKQQGPGSGTVVLTWDLPLERVTRIELALSAWESVRLRLLLGLTCGARCPRVTVRDPLLPGLMAR